jgi:hypothetical protein
MPHDGQVPGWSPTTSACMGQVNLLPADAGARAAGVAHFAKRFATFGSESGVIEIESMPTAAIHSANSG